MKKTSILTLIFLLLGISLLRANPVLGKTLSSTRVPSNTITGDSPYGATMNPSKNYPFGPQAVQDWHNLNMAWVRKQINWSDIETCAANPGDPNTYDFSQVDALVNEANLAHVLVDFPIQNPPKCHKDQKCRLPIAADEAAFATMVVQRYGSQIAAYEVGNEEWSNGPCQNDAQLYIPVLEQTYTAIKSLNPNVLVGMFGYTNYGPLNGNGGGLSYIHQFFVGTLSAPGLFADHSDPGSYMDYINLHDYIGGDPNNNILPFMDVVNEIHNDATLYGHGALPMWVTEYGWSLTQQGMTQAKQAQYMQEIYDDSRQSGVVTHAFYYTIDQSPDGFSITQGPNNQDDTQAYGMVKSYIAQYPQWLAA